MIPLFAQFLTYSKMKDFESLKTKKKQPKEPYIPKDGYPASIIKCSSISKFLAEPQNGELFEKP